MVADMRHAAPVALLFLLLPILLAAQQLPSQCDPLFLLTPVSVMFLGPAKEVSVGDIRYSYHRFGNTESGKPPLVLIGGLGATKYGWPLTMLEELQKTREVLIFDNALAGQTVDTLAEKRPLRLTIPFMAQSTVDLIAAMNFTTTPDVLGMSMGGMVALWMAANHDAAVRSVVAVATSYGGRDAPQPEGGINATLDYLASEAGSNDIGLLLPLAINDPGYCNLARDFISLQYAMVPGFMSLPGAGYAAGAISAVNALTVSPATRVKQANAIRGYFSGNGLLPQLAASSKQMLFISGTQDNIFPIATQTQAVSAVPASWLVQIPDAGHGVPIQHPAQFAQQVATFLDAVQGRRMTCVERDFFCAECAGTPGTIPGSQCQTCKAEFKLVAGKCQRKTCQELDGGCAQCAGAPGTFPGSQCRACKADYILNSATGKCRLKNCIERGFTNCLECNGVDGSQPAYDACKTCRAGYTVVQAQTAQKGTCRLQSCTEKDVNCAVCGGAAGTIAGGQCKACRSGFTLTTNGKCGACSAVFANCMKCNTAGGCEKCLNGFRWDANKSQCVVVKLRHQAA